MNKTWRAVREATHVAELNFAKRFQEHRESVSAAGCNPKYTALEWIRSNPVIPTLPRLTEKTA